MGWLTDRAKNKIEKMQENKDVNGLIKALKGTITGGYAAIALGELGDIRGVEPLIKTLNHWNPGMQTCAIIALGELGDTRAVEPIIKLLNNRNDAVRINAINALGKLGDVRAVEPLINALSDKDKDMRLCTATSLGEIGDTRAVEPLINALTDKNEKVRFCAAFALGELKDVRALKPLEGALNDEHEVVRGNAQIALQRLKSLDTNGEDLGEDREQTEVEKNKKHVELEIKGFIEKEIDAILNYGYTEQQIMEMRDSGKRMDTSELTPQPTSIHIEKVESLESISGSKISDSVVNRSTISGEKKKKINICPYCGEKLDFPDTPKFCPYCEKQILT